MKNSKIFIRKIHINNLEVLCSIGVHENEHIKPQRVIIDVEVNLVFDCFPKNDRIEETLNYDLIYSGIKKIVKSKHFNLLETFSSLVSNGPTFVLFDNVTITW